MIGNWGHSQFGPWWHIYHDDGVYGARQHDRVAAVFRRILGSPMPVDPANWQNAHSAPEATRALKKQRVKLKRMRHQMDLCKDGPYDHNQIRRYKNESAIDDLDPDFPTGHDRV